MTTFSVLLLRSTVVIVWPSTLPTYLHHDLWHDWSVGPWKRTIFCSSVMLPSSHAARSPGDAGVGGAAAGDAGVGGAANPCVRDRSDSAIYRERSVVVGEAEQQTAELDARRGRLGSRI